MPPCALAELHDWIEPFVASATRAPARSAETAAARPEAPLPITSTSNGPFTDIPRIVANPRDICGLYLSLPDILRCLWWQRYGAVAVRGGGATEGGTPDAQARLDRGAGAARAGSRSARPPAAAPTPGPAATPLPPDQAAALVAAAPATAPDALTVQAVSPQQALAAATAPGAAVYVAPGLSLQQAVGARLSTAGLSSTTASSGGRRSGVGRVGRLLRQRRRRGHWGTWPYEQKIYFTVYWSRCTAATSPTIPPATNERAALCAASAGPSNEADQRRDPLSWVVQRGSAGFSCPTVIPWVNLHPSHYLDVSVNSWGSAAEVGRG